MRATPADAAALAAIVRLIWPEHSLEELAQIIESYIVSDQAAVFAERAEGQFVGVALCSLRHDYVEGCETSPVGYLEGVGVSEGYRHQGIAKRLVSACEQWAREKGCTEFASDCELTNTGSADFHKSIGFQEMNRIVCFRKTLEQPQKI